MVLEGLGKSLRNVLGRIGSASSIDDDLIKDICKDLQRALLEADVNVKLVLELTNRVKDRATNEPPAAGRSMKDHVSQIIYQELVNLVDNGDGIPLKPQTIMMVGLYGQGKTTSTGKLALYYSKKGFSVGLIGADVYRPAALDQLKQLGEKVGVEVYGEPGESDAAGIVKRGLEKFKDRKKIVIIDTSGRHALEDDLIDEIKRIADVAKPEERVLVLDSQVGQQAGPQAEAFDANKFISRLLGMGDLSSLIELAKEEIDDTDAMQKVAQAMMSGRFNLNDMYYQMAAVGKMGPLQKVMSMIPGLSGMEDKIDYEASQKKLQVFRTIMDSMTNEEKEDPSIVKIKRIERIADGAGVTPHDVRELLKQYNQTKKTMTGMTKNRKMRKQMMKQLGGVDLDAFKDLQGSE